MNSFIDPTTKESIYQTIYNQPVQLTLCERVSKLFSRLYERISNLFSRKSNQIKVLEGIEPIYDVPKNNRPVKTLTLYKRVSKFFSRGPNRLELLEERVNRENAHLNLFIAQLQQVTQQQHHYICVNVKRIEHLEACVYALKDMVNTKEVQINSLKETILSLEEELYSNRTQVSQDSGFSESPSMEKKHSLFLKAKSYLETKIG